MKTNTPKLHRHDLNRSDQRLFQVHFRLPVLAILLLLAPLLPSQAGAEEPFRLKLVRVKADVEAKESPCIRGSLLTVYDFDGTSEGRGVWLADTLEIRRAPEEGRALRSGSYSGGVRVDGSRGWVIRIGATDHVLRAHPEGPRREPDGAVLLGRRPATAGTGPCELGKERLLDGAAITRRIQDVYQSRGVSRPVQLLVVDGDSG